MKFSIAEKISAHLMENLDRLALRVINLLPKPEERTFSIEAVSKAMNLPCGTVVSILKRKGFDTKEGFRTPVTYRMRDVLADEYVKTLHSVFDTVLDDPVTNSQMVGTIISFFKIYKYDHYSNLGNTLSWAKIDEDKIRQDFFNHVNQYDQPYKDSLYEDGMIKVVLSRRIIVRDASDLLYPAPLPSLAFVPHSPYSDDRDLDVSYGEDDLDFKNQTRNNFTKFIIHQMTSHSDPTSGRSQLLTPLTQRTSSGFFVRQVLLPHRYCIFGTSDDDDHISTLVSECNLFYKHCSIGMGSINYDTLYHRA